jgi:hypothetical protein
MAKAIATVVEVPQPTILKKAVQLTLSVNEAETLSLLMGKCGGNATQTRRSYTDAINTALQEAGYGWAATLERYRVDLSAFFEPHGGISFKIEKLDPSKDI